MGTVGFLVMAARLKPYDLAMAVRALPKSESAQTLVSSAANKRGLSKMLDGTLREGAHDMRVFGLGFLRSVASHDEYVHFTTGMFHFYGAMEERFAAADGLPKLVWSKFPELPRQSKIKRDLQMVGAWKESGLPMSAATERYVQAIHTAADEEGGVRLFGHFYVRYLADLFGGRALGAPTRIALSLPETPHFYVWCASVETDRRAYIERIYEELNAAGDAMEGAEQRDRVVEEARAAFAHNAAVYVEQPGLEWGAAKGAMNIAVGAISQRW